MSRQVIALKVENLPPMSLFLAWVLSSSLSFKINWLLKFVKLCFFSILENLDFIINVILNS